jgi:hypothetical protein
VATGSMRNWLRAEGIEALRGACDGGSKGDRVMRMYPPHRVFCKKRLEVADLTGVDFLGSAQEFARA